MKILHIISALSGGGAERQLSYLAIEQRKLGHEVHIFFHQTRDSDPIDLYIKAEVQLHMMNHGIYSPLLFLCIWRRCSKLSPDIVQSWISQMDIIGGTVSILCSIPWIMREPSNSSGQRKGWKGWLRKKISVKSKYIVSNSQGGKDYWSTIYPESKLAIVPNGFDVENIKKESLSPTGAESSYLLYVGRLVKSKNVDKVIRLFDSICLRYPQLELKICGSGPELVHLKSLAGEMLNNRILFCGHISGNEVYKLMRNAKALIFLSEHEGFPNIVLEAMISKVPLVLSSIQPHTDLTDDRFAKLINQHDILQTTKAVCEILDFPKEAEASCKLAYERARDFSVESMANQYMSHYERMLS